MDSSEIKVKIEPESEGMISEEQQEAKEDTSMENPVEGNFDIPLDEKILEAEQPDEAPPSEDTILDEQATNADEAVVKKEETEETSKEEAQPEAVVDQEMSQESTASIEPGELPVQNEGLPLLLFVSLSYFSWNRLVWTGLRHTPASLSTAIQKFLFDQIMSVLVKLL